MDLVLETHDSDVIYPVDAVVAGDVAHHATSGGAPELVGCAGAGTGDRAGGDWVMEAKVHEEVHAALSFENANFLHPAMMPSPWADDKGCEFLGQCPYGLVPASLEDVTPQSLGSQILGIVRGIALAESHEPLASRARWRMRLLPPMRLAEEGTPPNSARLDSSPHSLRRPWRNQPRCCGRRADSLCTGVPRLRVWSR